MSARRKGRQRALEILYAADLRGVGITEALGEEAGRAAKRPEQQESFSFATELVKGVQGEQEQIDQIISAHSTSWPLERMPIIDRSLLRIACFELLRHPETPTAVIISEAAKLAGDYGTDDSRGFIQGVLGAVAEHTRPTS